jgi:hypothetical protein
MEANTLLCGKDPCLLTTRALLLESAQIHATIVLSVDELETILSPIQVSLAVLSQLLAADELERAISIIRRRWFGAKILIFHFADEPSPAFEGCEYLHALVSPKAFITKAKELTNIC